MASTPFEIHYAQEAVKDIRRMRATDQRKIVEGIEVHLRHEPAKTSRSRIKQMVQPFWSQFRLRIDDFRVYYDVDFEKKAVACYESLKKGRRKLQRKFR